VLWRFSLYGFLKNQRYFEPFIVLAFLEKGLSFFVIGLLVAFREVTINFFEIPSGAVADVWGRRRSMMVSFAAYIVSFAVFAAANTLPVLFAAMFFFAVGDAFRTGTHKAMIFTWLRINGRESERTKVYGYTRSWSKIGSMVMVVLAAIFVFVSRDYSSIFLYSIVPYVVGLINFMGYPKELDGASESSTSLRRMLALLWGALRSSVRSRGLRRLMFESMGFEGVYAAAKDYIQPVLAAAAAVAIAHFVSVDSLTGPQRSAIVMGPVLFVLHFVEALASRNAHRVLRACHVDADGAASCSAEGEDRCARLLWGMALVTFGCMVPLMYFDVHAGIIAGFVVLAALQNLWRPVHISRFDAWSEESQGATVLSIESQAKSVATMAIAPLLGLAVDFVRLHDFGGAFWPVAAMGAAVSLLFVAIGAASRTAAHSESDDQSRAGPAPPRAGQ
jgi:MFS family permease